MWNYQNGIGIQKDRSVILYQNWWSDKEKNPQQTNFSMPECNPNKIMQSLIFSSQFVIMPQANYCKLCALCHSITTKQSTKENLDIRSCQHYGAELCSQSSLKENLYFTYLMETTKLQAYLKHYRIYPLRGHYGSNQAEGNEVVSPNYQQ
jgi:hypothetical protein